MAETMNPRIHPNANGGPPMVDGVTVDDVRKMQAMRRVWNDSKNITTPTELIAALHQIMFSDDNYESFQGTPTIARLCRVKKADTIQKALQTLERRELILSRSRGSGRSKLRRFQPQNLVEAEIAKYVENLPVRRATRSKGLPSQKVASVQNLPVEKVGNLPAERVGFDDSEQHLPVSGATPTRLAGVISVKKERKKEKTTTQTSSESVAGACDLDDVVDWKDASASDLTKLKDQLFAASDGAVTNQNFNLEIMTEPIAWLNSGADLRLDVLPTIKSISAKRRRNGGRLISTWSYFREAVVSKVSERKAAEKAISDAMGGTSVAQSSENKPRSALHAIALRKQAEADAASGGAQ